MKDAMPKPTTIFDRFKNAIRAFKGEPCASIQFGIDVKKCDECDRGTFDMELIVAEEIYSRLNGLRPEDTAELNGIRTLTRDLVRMLERGRA